MADGRRTRLPNASAGRRRAGQDGEDRTRAAGSTSKGQRTRRQLVDAARVVFERDGFLRARIADICDVAGVSHGTFYTYFLSKEEIFREVTDSVEVGLLTLRTSAGRSGPADPVERIRAANRHYLETYRDNAKILSVIHEVAAFDPEVRATREERQGVFATSIRRRVQALQQAGLADPAVDPAMAAKALGGMVAFWADNTFRDDAEADLDEAVEQLTLLWVNAIGLRHWRAEDPTAAPVGAAANASADE